jgi:uncharacterized secreted repeat protein (TIGR03808 family)
MDRRQFIRSIPAAAAGLLPARAAFAADPAYSVAIEDSAVLIGSALSFSGARRQNLSLAGAVAVAARAGKPLHILPGVYLTSGFAIASPLEIFGSPGTVAIRPAGPSCFNIDIRPPSESSVILGVTIRGIGFWGGGSDFAAGVDEKRRLVDPFLNRAMPKFNALITACRVRNLIIEQCSVGGSGAGGLALWRCENASVTRSEIHDCGLALYSAQGKDSLFADNDIHDNRNYGIMVEQWPPAPDGAIIRDNRIRNTAASFGADPAKGILGGSGPYGNGIFALYAYGVLIAGNSIADSAFSGVRMNACFDPRIVNNSIRRSGETAIMIECPGTDGQTPNGLRYEGGVVADNIVAEAGEGISVTNSWQGGRRVSITGNQIRSIARATLHTSDPDWPVYSTYGDGIYAEADVDVVGNTIENCDGCGIYVAPAAIRNSAIETAANVASNIVKSAQWGVGFWKGSDPALGFTLIQGNMIGQSSRGAIMALTSTQPPSNGTRSEDDGRDFGALDNGLYAGKPYPVVRIGPNYAF